MSPVTTTVRPERTQRPAGATAVRRRRLDQKLIRQLHLWTSMVCLVLVLFFGVTGFTLNHQDWTFGTSPRQTESTGTLPGTYRSNGQVDWLTVSEFARGTLGVHGELTDHSEQNGQGSLSYQSAGYQAVLAFDESTGAYTLTSTSQGWVAVINDLHKGRHTGPVWSAVIDASALLLVLVAATGLTITILIRTRERRRGLVLLGIGAVVALVGVLISLS
ncbi:peptidase [Naumannella sp. ID2617S]|nr:peptidase [Naumannella sp. ID2617S]